MNLLLVGATGTIGSALLKEVGNDSTINTSLLLRRPDNFQSTYPSVKCIKGDLSDHTSLKEALSDIDVVFLNSTPCPEMIKMQCNMIDACADIGIKYIVRISVIGASKDGSSSSPLSHQTISKWHSDIEAYASRKKVRCVAVRPSFFMQNFLNFLPTMRNDGAIYSAVGDGKIVPVDVRDIGKAIHAILKTDSPKDEYTITGKEALTFGEMAQQISLASGKNIQCVAITPDQLRENLLSADKPEWLADIMHEIFTDYRKGLGSFIASDFVELVHEEQILFSEFVKTLTI